MGTTNNTLSLPYTLSGNISENEKSESSNAFDASVARSLGRTAEVKITLSEPPVGKRKEYDAQGEELKFGRME